MSYLGMFALEHTLPPHDRVVASTVAIIIALFHTSLTLSTILYTPMSTQMILVNTSPVHSVVETDTNSILCKGLNMNFSEHARLQ